MKMSNNNKNDNQTKESTDEIRARSQFYQLQSHLNTYKNKCNRTSCYNVYCVKRMLNTDEKDVSIDTTRSFGCNCPKNPLHEFSLHRRVNSKCLLALHSSIQLTLSVHIYISLSLSLHLSSTLSPSDSYV